jgi:hypothetical protein
MPDYQPLQYAFVIMPFSREAELEKAYQLGIRRAVERLGIESIRTDQLQRTSRISTQIEQGIRGAYFVVADLTDERPNCYYELGFAHALGRPAILTARAGTELHFDVSDFQCIFYESEKDLREQLTRRIVGAVLTSPQRDPDQDEHNGQFGRCAIRNGRLMTARVVKCYEDEDESDVCDLQVDVVRLPGSRPLSGQVRYYVDPSYTDTYFVEQVKEAWRRSSSKPYSERSPWALRPTAEKTRLELDLATIPGAPPSFYWDL